MAPISSSVASRIRSAVLERMTCDGRLLMDLVRQQKYEEEESLKTWKLPVQIVSPLTAVIVLFLVIYAIRQKVEYLRVLNRDDWKINFYDIDFVGPKKRRRAISSAAGEKYRHSPISPENGLGSWNMHEVATRPLSIASAFDVNRKVKQTLLRMREEVAHENVARFFGIAAHNNAVYLVEQYASCALVDFFRANKYSVNESFLYVVCADIANGMAYLHRQNLIHGNLSTDKCHVDSRWTIKIVDWEYAAMYEVVRRTDRNKTRATREKSVLHFLCGEGPRAYRHLAPEIQKNGHLFEPSHAGDVFSFGIIIWDLFSNSLDQHHATVGFGNRMSLKARQVMELACNENAVNRPTFEQLEKSMRSAISGRQTNLMDCMIEMMQEYTNMLEERLHERDHRDRDHRDLKSVPDDSALNSEPVDNYPSSGRNFTNCRMAVMMTSVDSATTELGNDCGLVDVVGEAVTSVTGEIIVVEEAKNTMIVAVGPNVSQSSVTPVAQLLAIARHVNAQVAMSSPLTKLLAVMHVGPLSGMVRNTSQTPQQGPMNNKYELYGAAVDVCRQMMTETAAWTTGQYSVKVTKDAVDDDGGDGFESLTLVPDCPCFTNGGMLATFLVRDIDASVINSCEGCSTDDGAALSVSRRTLTDVDY